MKRAFTQNRLELLESRIRKMTEEGKLPPGTFERLKPYNKKLLHDLEERRTLKMTHAQLKDLIVDLGIANGRCGKPTIDQVDYLTEDELMEFFLPFLGEDTEEPQQQLTLF